MANPKDILVITTSATDGLKIKKHLKPVSAHVVAGTNLFSDFLGGFSDVFGGRSDSYQKQLTSLYNEAIERIKYNAHEIGANCVIGLSIDMDEISGKGKSMFMLTAIGTAVVIEKDEKPKIAITSITTNEKFENVGFERIKNLRLKNEIIKKANEGKLSMDDETWEFIISNQVDEVFHFVRNRIDNYFGLNEYDNFIKNFIDYTDALEESRKIELLYDSIKIEKNERTLLIIIKIIEESNLYSFDKIIELFNSDDFNTQKTGLQISMYDKPFYNKQDVADLKKVVEFVKIKFKERGVRSTIESASRIRDIWTCECGNGNDIGDNCFNCKNSISGFTNNEINPEEAVALLEQKIELINEYLA